VRVFVRRSGGFEKKGLVLRCSASHPHDDGEWRSVSTPFTHGYVVWLSLRGGGACSLVSSNFG
jgi:hypothetical protein